MCFCRFNSAKKDNDFVYHDKIPAFDTLPEIKGLFVYLFVNSIPPKKVTKDFHEM